MRRAVLLAATAAAAFVPVAGAAAIRGTARADSLLGTQRADVISGLGGADRIVGRGGADLVVAGTGGDRVEAGSGDDRVALDQDGARDRVACGPGRDLVTADREDTVAADCEVVTLAISRDPYRTPAGQHRTQVEPDSLAHGSTIVTTFQSGRFFDGGAANIGVSTSTDGGRTWTPTFLPGLSAYSTPPGAHPRVSDPAVAYDDAHGTWLVATLGVSPALTELLVSRSVDGIRWDPPVVAARSLARSLAYDKEWLVCDSWPSSPLRGRCYLAYTDVLRGELVVQTSGDGGLTWGGPVSLGDGFFAMPVVQPDGGLVVCYLTGTGSRPTLVAARSPDGGAGFGATATIAELAPSSTGGLRAPPVPSAEVAADGRVVVVWHDARFRAQADVVLSSSLDGVSWTPPARVPAVPAGSRLEPFVPGVGVDPASAGTSTRIAVVLYAYAPGAGVDAWLVTSADGGARWSRPQRLTARTMAIPWIADTNQGRMLADYLSVSWVDGRPVPVFSVASEPGVGPPRFRQAIAATVRGT
ncbi:MAG TPA: hypothetical protein VLB86_15855 [Gaiellaceae bacterium]|nr:hypothetical protein [Gaiellaceae bacterium]